MNYTPKEYHYTLYYYDQAGNLTQTIPPVGVAPLGTAQVNTLLDQENETAVYPDHTLRTRYAYNSLNQLFWQNTPDGGTSEFWYDDLGQLRLSQNAEQAKHNEYSYTQYDDQGRISEVGQLVSTAPIITQYQVQYPSTDTNGDPITVTETLEGEEAYLQKKVTLNLGEEFVLLNTTVGLQTP